MKIIIDILIITLLSFQAMAVDKVKPLKVESSSSGGTQNDDFPTETNPAEDYLAAKGMAFTNNDNRLIDTDASGNIQFKDVTETTAINVRALRTASNNIFNNTSTSFRSTNTLDAVKETRLNIVNDLTSTATTASGTLTLVNTSTSVHNITGTATGYSIVMPNATTLFNGHEYIIYNRSSRPISIKDGGSTTLFSLPKNAQVNLRLISNSTTAGTWFYTISIMGDTYYKLTSTTSFNTANNSDTLITGFTITPDAGTYFVNFSSAATYSTVFLGTLSYKIYVGGSAVADSVRTLNPSTNNPLQSSTVVTVNGSQAVDVRVSVTGIGASITVGARSLFLKREGN